MTGCCPRRELFREYGRGGPGVRGLTILLLGAGLGVNRGAPIWLLEKDPGPSEGPLPGVGAKVGGFRRGDSGLGREGLPFGLKIGLGARAPGPTD